MDDMSDRSSDAARAAVAPPTVTVCDANAAVAPPTPQEPVFVDWIEAAVGVPVFWLFPSPRKLPFSVLDVPLEVRRFDSPLDSFRGCEVAASDCSIAGPFTVAGVPLPLLFWPPFADGSIRPQFSAAIVAEYGAGALVAPSAL